MTLAGLWQAVCFKRGNKFAFATRQVTRVNISLGQIDARKFYFGHDFCPRSQVLRAITSLESAPDNVS